MESIILHQKAEALQARERAVETLRLVGIPKPEEALTNTPPTSAVACAEGNDRYGLVVIHSFS